MYVAKNGPDTVVVYRPDIDGHDPSLLSLMGELREAITTGEVGIEVEPVTRPAHRRARLRRGAACAGTTPSRGTLLPGLVPRRSPSATA